MNDSNFVHAVHTAHDAGFTIDAHLCHSSAAAKQAGLRGDIFEVVVRRRMQVFWIGQSLDRAEIQKLATDAIQQFVRESLDADLVNKSESAEA